MPAGWPIWNRLAYLAVDPTDPETLYAGGDGGLCKTSNAGGTWSPIEDGFGIRYVQHVAISPAAPRTIWVGSVVGFSVSRDAGASWSRIQGGYPDGLATYYIAPDPTRADVVLATNNTGLFRTLDGGAHWTRVLADGPAVVAIDSVRPWRVYAGGLNYLGVLRSLDGGTTWAPLANEMSRYEVRALAVDPAGSNVYAGAAPSAPHLVYRSADGGDTWTGLGASLPAAWPAAFTFDPRQPAVVYLLSRAGVSRSGNQGRMWKQVNAAMGLTTVTAIAVAPSDPRIAYAGAAGAGLFKSIDRGETWSPRPAGPSADAF